MRTRHPSTWNEYTVGLWAPSLPLLCLDLSREVLEPGQIRGQGPLSPGPPLFVHKMTWGRQRLVGGEKDEMAPTLLPSHLVATPSLSLQGGK